MLAAVSLHIIKTSCPVKHKFYAGAFAKHRLGVCFFFLGNDDGVINIAVALGDIGDFKTRYGSEIAGLPAAFGKENRLIQSEDEFPFLPRQRGDDCFGFLFIYIFFK